MQILSRLAQLTVVWLVVAAGATPVAGVAVSDTTDDTIDATYTVAHDPAGPSVTVQMKVTFPDRVTAFRTRLPAGVEVTATDGFTATDDGYEWDGETEAPTIDYRVPEDAGNSVLVSATYAALGQGNVVGAVSYRYRNPEVRYQRQVKTTGSGAVHGFAVSLWTNATTVEASDGTTVTVVKTPDSGPDAADFEASERRALANAVVGVDDFFGFDRTDDRIVVFPRPSDATGLEGTIAGRANAAGQIQLEADSASDLRVVAHEWVHTQQDFRTRAATDWFVEGSADYFAYYYTYHTSEITFQQFRQRLDVRDTEYAEVNLRELTNATEQADYQKGRHVAAGLDALLRERTDGRGRLADVLVTLRTRDGGDPTYGDGPAVGTTSFVSILGETANSSVDTYYGLATGPQTPPKLPDDPAKFSHTGTTQVTATPTPTPSTATPTRTPTATATASSSPAEPTTSTSGQPGFGLVSGLAVLTVLVARRWIG